MRILIIGGVAGGASAAARLRRLDEGAEIILLERGEHEFGVRPGGDRLGLDRNGLIGRGDDVGAVAEDAERLVGRVVDLDDEVVLDGAEAVSDRPGGDALPVVADSHARAFGLEDVVVVLRAARCEDREEEQ